MGQPVSSGCPMNQACSDRRPPGTRAEDETDDEDNQKHEEQNLRYSSERRRCKPEAEYRGDDRQYEKHQSPMQHV